MRYAKLEVETTPGDENTAGVVLPTSWFLPGEEVGFAPNPALLDRSNEIRGIDGRVVAAQNEYAPTGRIAIRGYARYLGALLYLLFGDVTTTAGGIGVTDPDTGNPPVGTFKHVFSKKSGPLPLTARATLEYEGRWLRARGVTVPTVNFTIADDGVRAEADLMANFVSRLTVDPADAPAYEDFAVLPFRRRNVVVTFPGLGSAVNLDSIDFSMEQTLEAVRDMGSRTGWPTDTERANSPEGFLRLQGSLTRRDFDAADWDALIAASVFGLKVAMKSEQNIAATAYPYSMWVETANAQYSGGGPENLKNQARHEASYDWQAGTDDPAEQDFTVTIVNDVPAYDA